MCRLRMGREACTSSSARRRAWEAFRTTLTGTHNTLQAIINMSLLASMPSPFFCLIFLCPCFTSRWSTNTFSIRGGKPLWVDPFDQHVQHIFIDDNIRQNDKDTIVHPRVLSFILQTHQYKCINKFLHNLKWLIIQKKSVFSLFLAIRNLDTDTVYGSGRLCLLERNYFYFLASLDLCIMSWNCIFVSDE